MTARKMLAKRLLRFGLSVWGGSVTAILTKQAAQASVPSLVICSTIKVATLFAAGKPEAAGLISDNAAALARLVGVLCLVLPLGRPFSNLPELPPGIHRFSCLFPPGLTDAKLFFVLARQAAP